MSRFLRSADFVFLTLALYLSSATYAEETEKTSQDTTLPSKTTPLVAAEAETKDKVEQSPSDKALEVPLPITTDELNARDINHYIEAETITKLLAGPNEIITLITTDTSQNSKGVAILLPDWQQTATNPKGLNYLRQKLPEQGWTTIAIQPPSRPDNYPSQVLNVSEQEVENKKSLVEYQGDLSQIMVAVMKKAADYPGIFIVITQGNHGALLTELYQTGKVEHPSAFVILSSYMPTLSADQQYARALADTDFPVLDLYLSKDHPLVKSSAKLRLTATKKTMKAYYRQAQLKNMRSGYYPERGLVSAINGWLSTVGW